MNEFREHNGPELPHLEAMKEQMSQLAVPPEVDAMIKNGIRLGQRRRRRRMITRMVSSTVCLLLLIMVASVRFSPVVAAYVGDVPGLRSLVELIHDDKGLKLALENDFMQPVGLSDEHDGIRLTVDGILADESRVIVFYTLRNEDGRKRAVSLQRIKLVNDPESSISYGNSNTDVDWISKQGTIDFNFQDGTGVPDTLNMEMNVGEDNDKAAQSAAWTFRIPVDKAKFEGLKETFAVDKTVTVEGQRITFGKMTVYPTRIGLEVAYDPANTKKLFYFDDIRLEDEDGEIFGTIDNGVSAMYVSENRLQLFFQSSYFRKPGRLYLRANSIRALDKNKLEVTVDLDGKKLLTRPDDRLSLLDVRTGTEDGQDILAFQLKNEDPLDKDRQYHLLDMKYKDASGRLFDSNMTGSFGDEFQYYVKKTNYRSPLTLQIADYPSRIHGDINLRVK